MALLAHQGGWDELLFVATPVVLFAGLLLLARSRAEREAADADEPVSQDDQGQS